MSDIDVLPTNTCPPDIGTLLRTSHTLSFARSIQLDVCDGRFAEPLSWPLAAGQADEVGIASEVFSAVPHEAHLMVESPLELGVMLGRAGIVRLVPHLEAFSEPAAFLHARRAWKDAGVSEVALALLMETPLPRLEEFLAECDGVQLMGIARIGRQGVPFDERVYGRVRKLHALHPELAIAVDGGVSLRTIGELVRAGARRLCVGSAIADSPDMQGTYRALMEAAESAIQ